MTSRGVPGLRAVVAAGGTGGHVYPVLAVAAALRRQRPEIGLLFIGADRIEARLAPEAGLPFRAISVHGIAGRGLSGAPRRMRALGELMLGLPLLQSISALRGFRPQVVIGAGGYVSGPVLLAARLLCIPSVSLEGNWNPGLTSRALVRLVDVMAVADPRIASFFAPRMRRGGRVAVTGLPIRRDITEVGRRAGAESLCLDPSVTTLLVLGGSLGSKSINEALLGAMEQLERDRESLGSLQVLHVTGHQHCPAASRSSFANYRSVPYLDRCYPEALAAADLVVSRAGASTVAEIAARGLPAVLIPWSGASCDEQVRNAEHLVRAGAAVMILDRELTPERLAAVLSGLLRDTPRRAQMAEASGRLGRPEAAEEVASIALELAERRRAVSPRQDSSGGRSV